MTNFLKLQPSVDSIEGQLKYLIGKMKETLGFRISDQVTGRLSSMAQAIEEGVDALVIEHGLEALKAGRNILGAFLRHSVIDRMDGEKEIAAWFTREIEKRRENDAFDIDLMGKLEVARLALEEAVKEEMKAGFDRRV